MNEWKSVKVGTSDPTQTLTEQLQALEVDGWRVVQLLPKDTGEYEVLLSRVKY